MDSQSIQLFERTTGDEIFVSSNQARVRLAVREEVGDWTAVELSPTLANELSVALCDVAETIKRA